MFLHGALLIFVLMLHGQVHAGGVIGGHEAVPHSRPYMVLLEGTMANGHEKKYCDGFLLSQVFVMTAAHCQAKSYNVLLGVHNYFNKTGVQNLTVGKAFPHKKYNENTYQNDIMLLKLSSKVRFNINIRPIALPDHDITLPTSCIVSGWGKTNRNNKGGSHVLMEVKVTLIDNEKCKDTYCSEGENGPGKGDSGGPLVCADGKAFGVVSASTKNGPPLYKYTKILDNREWIDNFMEHY